MWMGNGHRIWESFPIAIVSMHHVDGFVNNRSFQMDQAEFYQKPLENDSTVWLSTIEMFGIAFQQKFVS